MADNVQPLRDNQRITCTELKSVGGQKKRENPANKPMRQKARKEKENQENNREDTIETTSPITGSVARKDEQSKDDSGSMIDLEI